MLDLFVAENAKATDEWETLENAVCVRLAGAVLALHHLSQSAIVRAVTEPLLKASTTTQGYCTKVGGS